jgi:biopolymer transport protein ExbD
VLLIIFMVAAPDAAARRRDQASGRFESAEISSERVFIDVPLSYRNEKRVYLGKESIGMPVLAERLRQLMANRSDKQAYLRIDRQLFVQDQIDVMQEMKNRGHPRRRPRTRSSDAVSTGPNPSANHRRAIPGR